MNTNKKIALTLHFILLLTLGINGCTLENVRPQFQGEIAFQFLSEQLSFGPRYPESNGHEAFINWAIDKIQSFGWIVHKQIFYYHNIKLTNIIAEKGQGKNWILLGAHYDSRKFADQDATSENLQKSVPGANDGASGTAILLELARTLTIDPTLKISLVLFDGEDQGQIAGWDWIVGSNYYVSQLIEKPSKTIIIDMVGDNNLNIYRERSSDQFLTDEIWKTADSLGYSSYFINETKYTMLDDHTPFLSAQIPAVLLIDFDYPYWHTTKDTLDKVSPLSLHTVGQVLQKWISQQR